MKTLPELRDELVKFGILFNRPAAMKIGDKWITSPIMTIEKQYESFSVTGVHDFYFLECVAAAPNCIIPEFEIELRKMKIEL